MAYYVDLPVTGSETWENVFIGETKEEAVEWIRSNIGYCDDDGNISLISQLDEEEEEEEDFL